MLHPLSNMEITGDGLPIIKDGASVVNPNDSQSKWKHWISLFLDRKTVAYFDSFGNEYILEIVVRKIRRKQSLTT